MRAAISRCAPSRPASRAHRAARRSSAPAAPPGAQGRTWPRFISPARLPLPPPPPRVSSPRSPRRAAPSFELQRGDRLARTLTILDPPPPIRTTVAKQPRGHASCWVAAQPAAAADASTPREQAAPRGAPEARRASDAPSGGAGCLALGARVGEGGGLENAARQHVTGSQQARLSENDFFSTSWQRP